MIEKIHLYKEEFLPLIKFHHSLTIMINKNAHERHKSLFIQNYTLAILFIIQSKTGYSKSRPITIKVNAS